MNRKTARSIGKKALDLIGRRPPASGEQDATRSAPDEGLRVTHGLARPARGPSWRPALSRSWS